MRMHPRFPLQATKETRRFTHPELTLRDYAEALDISQAVKTGKKAVTNVPAKEFVTHERDAFVCATRVCCLRP